MRLSRLQVFVLLTVAFTGLIQFVIIVRGGVQHQVALTALGMWAPGLAAIFAKLYRDRTLRGLGWKWPKLRFLAIAYVLPVVYAGAIYAGIWLSGLAGFNSARLIEGTRKAFGLSAATHPAVGIIILLTGAFVLSGVAALGEEIGWRGFLAPELFRRFGFVKSALLTGCIWSVWHWPLLLFGGYNAHRTPLVFALACFSIGTIGECFAYAWLRLASGSLWPAVFLHAAHNLFVQAVFDPLTQEGPYTRWFTTEFGLGAVVWGGCLAVTFARFGKKMVTDERSELIAEPRSGQEHVTEQAQ